MSTTSPERRARRSRLPAEAATASSLVRVEPRAGTVMTSLGRVVLITGRDGFVTEQVAHGLIVDETRVLSRWRWRIDGDTPPCIAQSPVERHSWHGYYLTLPPGFDEAARYPNGAWHEQSLELKIARFLEAAMREDLTLTNFSRETTRFRLYLDVAADFRDLHELGSERRQHGSTHQELIEDRHRPGLRLEYRAEHDYDHQGDRGHATVERWVELRFPDAPAPLRLHRDGLFFDIELAPRQSCRVAVEVFASGVDPSQPLGSPPRFFRVNSGRDALRREALLRTSRFELPVHDLSAIVAATLESARQDLAAMRLFDLDQPDGGWVVAAGQPMYVALFGRDTLTAGWQAGTLTPEIMRGAVGELARWQGVRWDDWRDEAPGRMLHEAHRGPLSELQYNPQGRYYGTITAPAFFPVALVEAWHWTGDDAFLDQHLPAALDGLRWLDEYSRADDGFYYYQTRSEQGVENQGWRDSHDAIVDEDGRIVQAPIAPAESQGFVYQAKQLLAMALLKAGRIEQARRLHREAVELKQRFDEVFWMEDLEYYAMALGPGRRQIRSICSSPGHCMATAIADRSRLEPTLRRLFADDLFSGWGMRTLSSEHPAFDPYAYHRGSVWPVETGTFCLGLMRWGQHERLSELTRALFDAASLMPFCRLPEAFSGHPRDADHPFPAFYPKSCLPQAWSASSVYTAVQALLGIYPFAPLNLLFVDPHLPKWLPRIRVRDLRVGDARITLSFERGASGRTTYRIDDIVGELHVVRQASPWSLTEGPLERAFDALQSLLPGR